MANENVPDNDRLILLAGVFDVLASSTKRLMSVGVQFEPSALDAALNMIGARLFFSNPDRRGWQRQEFRHWIKDGTAECEKLIEISRGGAKTLTTRDVGLVFKAPPPE